MAGRMIETIEYEADRDILYLGLGSCEESVTTGKGPDLLLIYDRSNKNRLVGIEALDFTRHVVPNLDSEDEVPDIGESFQIRNTNLKDADLRAVLRWSYENKVRADGLYVPRQEKASVVAERGKS